MINRYVRIISAGHYGSWFNDHIGEQFVVIDSDDLDPTARADKPDTVYHVDVSRLNLGVIVGYVPKNCAAIVDG